MADTNAKPQERLAKLAGGVAAIKVGGAIDATSVCRALRSHISLSGGENGRGFVDWIETKTALRNQTRQLTEHVSEIPNILGHVRQKNCERLPDFPVEPAEFAIWVPLALVKRPEKLK